MANFEGFPSGHNVHGRVLPAIQTSYSIGLWGYIDTSTNKELDVFAVDSWYTDRELPNVTLQPGKVVGNTRVWNVTSTTSGKVRLEARSDNGVTWTWVDIVFTVPPNSPGTDADRAALLAAVQSGQIVGATQQITAVCNKGYMETSDSTITLSGPTIRVLGTLARTAKVNLMSLMRYNEGPHGVVQYDGTAIGRAMDIQQFGEFPINLINGNNVDNTIKGIAAVIGALPSGLYAVGLTRPSVRAKGPPMPDKDVFLPVRTDADIYRVGTPYNNPTPQFRNSDAAKAINDALTQNPAARIAKMFEDGPDHMHLEVIQ
jgi:hypothetical protein